MKGSYDQWAMVRKMERGGRDNTWVITAYLPPGVYQVRACAATPPSPPLLQSSPRGMG